MGHTDREKKSRSHEYLVMHFMQYSAIPEANIISLAKPLAKEKKTTDNTSQLFLLILAVDLHLSEER